MADPSSFEIYSFLVWRPRARLSSSLYLSIYAWHCCFMAWSWCSSPPLSSFPDQSEAYHPTSWIAASFGRSWQGLPDASLASVLAGSFRQAYFEVGWAWCHQTHPHSCSYDDKLIARNCWHYSGLGLLTPSGGLPWVEVCYHFWNFWCQNPYFTIAFANTVSGRFLDSKLSYS